MAAPASAFAHHSHPLRSSQASFPLTTPVTSSFDPDAIKSAAAPFSTADPVSVLFRHLPPTVTLEQVKMMVMWSEEVANIEIFPDTGDKTCSALVKFNSHNDALQAKHILDGKQNMDVEILGLASPSASRSYGIEPATSGSSAGSSATSSGPSSRQPSRFNGAFPPVDKISPSMGAAYGANELPNPEESARYQTLFSPQSPIGVHLSDRGPRISGKSLIKNDTADDDETGELLKDPVAYAENGTMPSQRRATAPHLPISQLASLSLGSSSAAGGPSSLPPYGPHGIMQGHPTVSPTAMNGGTPPGMPYSMGGHFGRHSNFPPVNPADQNPPCNTLYVGNLPIDTSEEELKAMFSKQRGYKRLCFRTKQNGPMCFVEFEDVTFATKALNELYGQMLHNSVKGGIRLSFSKNPLGVRSGQTGGQVASGAMTSTMAGSPNGFTTASGPPPGLSAPPGLGAGRYGGSHSNQSYTLAGFPGGGSMSNNPWNSYKGSLASGGPNSMMGSNGSSNYMAPHMLGK